ncbi:MAG: SdpI family protein [Rhizobiales bacterium]|nr:SdpI family protein [Hyphomicrobiales bacterium]NRB14794.1 SdpI family protein [Hyphomicrobiales bacterium]
MSFSKISWAILAVVSVASLYAYTVAPADMLLPMHWDVYGEADGEMNAKMVLLLFPAVMGGILLLLGLLKYIDPRQENLKKSDAARQWTILALTLFLSSLALNNVAMVLGYEFLSYRGILFASMLMVVVIGNYLPKTRSNFFIGIKTPWTLSSEDNWKKTHRLGGQMFMIFGSLGIVATILLPDQILLGALLGLVIAPIIIVPVAYSWYLWRSEIN